jgi:xanthine dehydrogenase molybdopterin-binding subunit B
VRIGGQEHFYLEPNSCLCLPGEAGEEMTVISSTQAPTHTQQDVAKALGLGQHKVRRLGLP